jgi:predicted transcriptional regulator
MTTKNLLLRLDAELAEQLAAVAEVEGESVTAVVREAVAAHVARRRHDPEFQRLLRSQLDRHARLLELLAEDEG